MAANPTLLRMARAMCPMDWEKTSHDIKAFWVERARLGLREAEIVQRCAAVEPDTGNAGALE